MYKNSLHYYEKGQLKCMYIDSGFQARHFDRDDEKDIVKMIADMMIIEGYSFKGACDLLDIEDDDEYPTEL